MGHQGGWERGPRGENRGKVKQWDHIQHAVQFNKQIWKTNHRQDRFQLARCRI